MLGWHPSRETLDACAKITIIRQFIYLPVLQVQAECLPAIQAIELILVIHRHFHLGMAEHLDYAGNIVVFNEVVS